MMKNIFRKTMVLVAALLLTWSPMHAQVLIMDEEFEGTERTQYDEFDLIVPYEGGDADVFTPIGDGLVALGLLGGAYLLAKRKKRE